MPEKNVVQLMRAVKRHSSQKERLNSDYYMSSRAAEKELRGLQIRYPVAALVLSVLRERMQPDTNVVHISPSELGAVIGRSRSAVVWAIKRLKDHRYVQLMDGEPTGYTVNSRVAFSGGAIARGSVFSDEIVPLPHKK